MTSINPPAYIPGQTPTPHQPLGRFLPPTPEGVAAAWLDDHVPKGSWVIDPFGASPDLVCEIARKGYRVLVTANNPVIAFLLQMKAATTKRDELIAALATLGSTRIRDTRIEPFVRSLYQTECRNCGQIIDAESFLWKKDAERPFAVVYDCHHCDEKGEFPLSERDISRVNQTGVGELNRARALERVAPLNDPDRAYAEEALSAYPDRAIYVLSTLINKLDGMSIPTEELNCLCAILLNGFDRANTLWPYPTARERPKALTVPPQYRENNIWLALEEALDLWDSEAPTIPFSFWPELPPEDGGICLFEGRVKDSPEQLSKIKFRAVLTSFPRPNQAFWTLSALWAGWLWGSEGTQGFKSVLRRQRYSWRWHAVALTSALRGVRKSIPQAIPFLGLVSEVEPGFLTAVMTAIQLAQYDFRGMALCEEERQAQLSINTRWARKQPIDPGKIKEKIQSGAEEFLQMRAEPSTYLPLLAAGLQNLGGEPADTIPPDNRYSEIQEAIDEAISYQAGFIKIDKNSQSPEIGYWWLPKRDIDKVPLADRVEIEIVNLLLKNPGKHLVFYHHEICKRFPGLLTPSFELICMCLESYGKGGGQSNDHWQLREDDLPQNRRKDIDEMQGLIEHLGKNLGLKASRVQTDPLSIAWRDEKKSVPYTFYISASALLGKIFISQQKPQGNPVIILPGSRSNLVTYKLKHNPLWEQTVKAGWRFLKYRHLRLLAKNPSLTLDILDEQFDLDPLTYSESQIRLF